MNYEQIPYVTGRDDCYGLARLYFKHEYGLRMKNYARPFRFDRHGLNLIADNFAAEGFQSIDAPLSQLEVGDILSMAIAGAKLPNHLAIYVGNNFILHHLYQRPSIKENFSSGWRSRVLNILRHPEVTEQNLKKVLPAVDILTLLPPHVRAQIIG